MKKLSFFLALSCSLWACKDSDTPPVPNKPILKVTVFDATEWSTANPNGTVAPQATVALYASREAYVAKNPAFTAITDDKGIATFSEVTGDTTYYMVASFNDKTNTWDNGSGHTKVADGIFQTQAEIDAYAIQANAAPGDFKFKDLNGDGMISNDDLADAPYYEITVASQGTTSDTAIVGFLVNHEMKKYTTLEQVDAALLAEAKKISALHQRYVMLDGVLSDQADCSGLPAEWCDIDQFKFTASNPIITNIWNDSYKSIQQLNLLEYSLIRIGGGDAGVALTAQVIGFRTFLFVELCTYFGEIPLVFNPSIPENIARTPLLDIHRKLEQELLRIYEHVPKTTAAGKKWQINYAAANMLFVRMSIATGGGRVGRARMYNSSDALRDSLYKLVPRDQLFASQNGPEIVWDMTFDMPSPFKEYFVRNGQSPTFCPVFRASEAYLQIAGGNISESFSRLATPILNTFNGLYNEPLLSEEGQPDEALWANTLYSFFTREFYREGYRFQYLMKRWPRTPLPELVDKGFKDYNNLMPIPVSFLNKYPNITQNVGY